MLRETKNKCYMKLVIWLMQMYKLLDLCALGNYPHRWKQGFCPKYPPAHKLACGFRAICVSTVVIEKQDRWPHTSLRTTNQPCARLASFCFCLVSGTCNTQASVSISVSISQPRKQVRTHTHTLIWDPKPKTHTQDRRSKAKTHTRGQTHARKFTQTHINRNIWFWRKS